MEKIKVIFLDIDGVLNVYSHDHDEFGSQFMPQFVNNLKRVVEETGAKTGCHSHWSGLAYGVLQGDQALFENIIGLDVYG